VRAQGYDGEISSIYILRSAQRQGFGSALMAAMAQQLGRCHLQAASQWVLRENVSARGFYERIGGEIVGEKEDIRQYGVLIEVAYGWHNLAELAELAARTAAHCTKLV
jgi:ribosomal protein S18 acetylase RimI-like enzyme